MPYQTRIGNVIPFAQKTLLDSDKHFLNLSLMRPLETSELISHILKYN